MQKITQFTISKYSLYSLCFIFFSISSQAKENIKATEILNHNITKNWSSFSRNKVADVISKETIDYHKLGLIFLSNDEHIISNEYFTKSKSALALFYRAYSQYKQNNLENSLILAKEYLSKSQLNESGVNLYVNILYDMGNFIELKKAIDLSMKNKITNQNITYKQGLINLNDNNCSQAIEKFESILLTNPNATKLNIPLSKAYRMCDDQFKANDLLKGDNNGLLVSNDPFLIDMYEFGNPTYLLKPKIKALLQIQDYDNALVLIKRLTTIQPFDAGVWINYGSILVYQGQNLHEAELAYKKAYDLDPKNQLNLRNLISVTQKTNAKESIKWASTLLEINPNQINALSIIGDYNFNNKEYTKAIEIYNKLYEQSHDDINVLMKIVKILVIKKDYDLAIKKCEEAFIENNKSTKIASILSRVLLISSINNESDETQINDEYIQRALRISRNIVRIENNHNNKFTLLMSLTLSNQEKEAKQLQQELTDFSFNSSDELITQQLDELTDFNETINNLDFNWIW